MRPVWFHEQYTAMQKILTMSILLATATAMAGNSTDWAIQSQNPMADILKLPLQNNFNSGTGHKSQTEYRLNLKPSMPSDLSSDWTLVNRLDIPFIYQPGRVSGEKDSFGLGDTTYESFYGPAGDRTLYWGAGPAFQIPTATDNQIGSKKWSAGLAATASMVKGPVVAGVRANHLWSFAGKDDRADINRTTFEYFAYWNLGSGWWIGTSPVNTADWDAIQSEVWTIPIGGGIGKIVMRGRTPINLKLEAYHYAEVQTGGADWSAVLSIEFLLPEDILYKQ